MERQDEHEEPKKDVGMMMNDVVMNHNMIMYSESCWQFV